MSDPQSPEPRGSAPDTPAPPEPIADTPAPPTAEAPVADPAAYGPAAHSSAYSGTSEPAPRGVRRLLLIIASALAAFIACAALALVGVVLLTPAVRNQIPFFAARPGSGPPPEAPNKFVDQPPGRVSISDDFSRSSDRWDRSQTQVTDGAYEISLDLDNFDSYGLFLATDSVSDFDLAVDATQTAGPANGEFGIRFRQSAPDEHLMFSISPSGYYRLLRVSDKTYTSLVPWTHGEGIKLGPGVANRLRVVADGPDITAYINGEQVLTYTDKEPQSGQLTLGLVTFEAGGLAVRFDNLEGFAVSNQPDARGARLDLAEDFSDPAAVEWSVGGATISAGAYECFVGDSVISWQQPLPAGSSEVTGDFVLEVDAAMLSGQTDDSAYGVMFGDGGNFDFFALMIVPDGQLLMFRSGDEGYVIIPAFELPALNPGLEATNRIKVEVSGRSLIITINDQELPTIALPDGVSMDGMVGLILQGADSDGARARFDNFRLQETE